MSSRHNRKGRSKDQGRFVQLHYFLLESAAWLSLSPAARVVYVELARLYDGRNNGFLALSVRVAAERCRINKDTATRAIRELTDTGFIELTCPGGFSRKVRHSAEFRLSFFTCDRTGFPPAKAFLSNRATEPPER